MLLFLLLVVVVVVIDVVAVVVVVVRGGSSGLVAKDQDVRSHGSGGLLPDFRREIQRQP